MGSHQRILRLSKHGLFESGNSFRNNSGNSAAGGVFGVRVRAVIVQGYFVCMFGIFVLLRGSESLAIKRAEKKIQTPPLQTEGNENIRG